MQRIKYSNIPSIGKDGLSRINLVGLYAVPIHGNRDMNKLLEIFLATAEPKIRDEIAKTWDLVDMKFPEVICEDEYYLGDSVRWIADKMGLDYHSGTIGICGLEESIDKPIGGYIGIKLRDLKILDLVQSLVFDDDDIHLISLIPTAEQRVKMHNKLGKLANNTKLVWRVNGCMCCS